MRRNIGENLRHKIELYLKPSYLIRLLVVNIGFLFVAIGIVLILNSRMGANSWNVLHVGLSNSTSFTLGQSIQTVSVILVIVNWFLGEQPELATLLESITVGMMVDAICCFGIIPLAKHTLFKLLFMIGGTVCLGFGTALYIKAGLGKGARDGLMFALKRFTPFSLGFNRTIVEVVVLLLGIFLKGPFGLGSIAVTLTVGWVTQISFTLFDYIKNKIKLWDANIFYG